MKKAIFAVLILITFGMIVPVYPKCTVAVISGKATPDGRPLLWKNRDSSTRNNQIMHFKGEKYDFIGVVNAGDPSQVWMGINSAGLAIMNSESKDLEGSDYDDEGYLMRHVLGNFGTIREFQNYLDLSNGVGRSVTSNFGLIDAQGGAGFFETGNTTYTFFNANDPNNAPDGLLVRANYAETGNGKGYGYYRRSRAEELLQFAVGHDSLTHKYILQAVARDVKTETINPYPLDSTSVDTLSTGSTVDRHRTVSCAVFHGVRAGEDPKYATMWTILGEPVAGVAIPLWVASGKTGDLVTGSQNAPLNLTIQSIEEQLYPLDGQPTILKVSRLPEILGVNIPLENLILDATAHTLDAWRADQNYLPSVQQFQYQVQQTVQSVLQSETR